MSCVIHTVRLRSYLDIHRRRSLLYLFAEPCHYIFVTGGMPLSGIIRMQLGIGVNRDEAFGIRRVDLVASVNTISVLEVP